MVRSRHGEVASVDGRGRLRLAERVLAWAFALLACGFLLGSCVAAPPGGPSRIVAVGDVHGDYAGLLRILQAAELTDAAGHWTGGKATLVQVGDLIDRGPDDRRVLELMMALEAQAARAGGRVVALLGNHEVMNLHGDLRYVSAEAYASFADTPGAEERLDAAYAVYLELSPVGAGVAPETRDGFAAAHPAGFLEHREAFGPKGRIGKWLRKRPALASVGGVVFVHGGIHPEVASRGLRQLNRQIHAELAGFDAAREYLVRQSRILPSAALERILAAGRLELDSARTISPQVRQQLERLAGYDSWLVAHPSGPLWFRGFAEWSDEEAAKRVPELLELLGAQHFVVGHTPQLGRGITRRLGGQLFLIDCGILGEEFYPGGVEQALEIRGDEFRIIDAARARVSRAGRS